MKYMYNAHVPITTVARLLLCALAYYGDKSILCIMGSTYWGGARLGVGLFLDGARVEVDLSLHGYASSLASTNHRSLQTHNRAPGAQRCARY